MMIQRVRGSISEATWIVDPAASIFEKGEFCSSPLESCLNGSDSNNRDMSGVVINSTRTVVQN
jgi:hypothetical protein